MATMDNESLQIGAQMNSVWIWFAVAAILLAGEMITTSFVLIFFALGAAATAALVFGALNGLIAARLLASPAANSAH